MGYFVAADPGFGRLAWMFFVLQWFLAGAGAYLVFAFKDRYPYREQVARQMGTALLILGGVGTVVGLLRLLEVSIFNARYWFYIQLLLELALTGYLVYYFRSVYPARMAEAKAAPRRPAPRPVPLQQSSATPAPPRPVATTGRRDARRDRKRKGR